MNMDQVPPLHPGHLGDLLQTGLLAPGQAPHPPRHRRRSRLQEPERVTESLAADARQAGVLGREENARHAQEVVRGHGDARVGDADPGRRVVRGADVRAPGEGGHGDGVGVQHGHVVTVASVCRMMCRYYRYCRYCRYCRYVGSDAVILQ